MAAVIALMGDGEPGAPPQPRGGAAAPQHPLTAERFKGFQGTHLRGWGLAGRPLKIPHTPRRMRPSRQFGANSPPPQNGNITKIKGVDRAAKSRKIAKMRSNFVGGSVPDTLILASGSGGVSASHEGNYRYILGVDK